MLLSRGKGKKCIPYLYHYGYFYYIAFYERIRLCRPVAIPIPNLFRWQVERTFVNVVNKYLSITFLYVFIVLVSCIFCLFYLIKCMWLRLIGMHNEKTKRLENVICFCKLTLQHFTVKNDQITSTLMYIATKKYNSALKRMHNSVVYKVIII